MGSELELYAMRPVAVGFVKKAVTESKERGRQVSRLEESIKSLEEEKRKIEAFKRELPLCIRLVCEGVIEELKREIDRFRAEGFGRVFLEFMPIKGKINESTSDFKDKKNWTSSFQLWIREESKDTKNMIR
ncbi:myb family transcription factor EFM-like isoform X2 [Zingiber officinale]|uniref:myb family transcription factor EFM-like isoform X2 n=1 Tax=Zingiber officinale TaxID=94328 RepID=UPI001C4CACF3|nr:myb family transcription factor EFM-like isoform X2 [Zingiber officinale]